MEVLGRDPMREGYRVKARGAVAVVPDVVISRHGALTGGRGHQTAYDWIARNAAAIETAMDTLARGEAARPPFDMLELEIETSEHRNVRKETCRPKS